MFKLWGGLLIIAWIFPEAGLIAQEKDSTNNALLLEVTYHGFFKNNEYQEDYAKGYTLAGAHVTPLLSYRPHQDFSIKGGVHLLKYSGIDNFSKSTPFLSVQARLAPSATVTLGSFTQSQRHPLSRFLFSDEYILTDFIEEGILFQFEEKNTWLDAWIDWKQFIFAGDNQQERFNAGLSALWQVYRGNSDGVVLRGQAIATHRGGQIDVSDKPVSTLLNSEISVAYAYSFANSSLKKLVGQVAFQSFNDINGNGPYGISGGWGNDYRLDLVFKRVIISPGYWFSENFVAPYGHPLFQATSLKYPRIQSNNNTVAYMEVKHQSKIAKNCQIVFGGNLFYLMNQGSWQHDLELRLIFSSDFFLTSPTRK